MQVTAGFVVVHNLHRLFYLTFVVEVHLDMDALTADVVE